MAEDVLRSLEEMKPAIDGPCGEVVRADAVRQVMMRAILGREAEVRRKTDELVAKDEEILHLQQELGQEQVGCIMKCMHDCVYHCHSFRLSELVPRNNFNILMHSFIIRLLIYNRNRYMY